MLEPNPMNKKSWIILVLLTILSVSGYFYRQATPSITNIRANPALFKFSDYLIREKLHARLSTLFPRGTAKQTITDFFNQSGAQPGETAFETCTYTIPYNRADFIFDRKTNELLSIQIGDWPGFVAPSCNRGKPLTPTAPENPHYLKMEELDSAE